ncbi:hypothetical protein [Actinacidiphila yeochonensis]|uniref:hypothetical protein n=1 Tax=Actinacidiphila yeochonensis TaxID=89050 RepID=UPI000A8C2ABA|nr:hypothetical protein [Actinacidiphila yeochonensis]
MGQDTPERPSAAPPDAAAPPGAEVLDEGELLVLTAATLTPGRYPAVLGDDYPAACAELGLAALPTGYGLVFGQDRAGARWTVATTDAAMVACALAAWDCGLPYDLSPDEDTMIASLPGWPLPLAVAAPGVPEPHDPGEEADAGPVLAPPDVSVWGPAQRRQGADEIAMRWRKWRDAFDAVDGAGAPPAGTGPDSAGGGRSSGEAAAPSDGPDSDSPAPDAADAAAADGGPVPGAAPGVSHPGVRAVLAAAEEYVRTPPPPGRVRTAYGTVRADGPGWSLVGRADDVAFVLLDDAPGEVLPVGRGPSLPRLLGALGGLVAAAP